MTGTTNSGSTSGVDKLKSLGAVVVTFITGLLVAWWLYEVSTRLGKAATLDPEGNIILDEFQRAKDILIIVLPLFTAAIGYWVGNQGVSEAKKDAKQSEEKVNAVLSEAPADVIERARTKYPGAFA